MTGRVVMRVAVVAQGDWATRLRSYLHDHVSSVRVEALLDRAQMAPGRFDVLVVDDATRVLGGADVSAAVAAGTIVVGLFDPRHSSGEDYLQRLGASRIYRADTDTAQLASLIEEIGPVHVDEPVVTAAAVRPASGRGALTVVSAANGGAGATETVIALAERWGARRRVLVVEANPMAAVLAYRLRRRCDAGMAWVLGLVAQGRPVVPTALSPAWWSEANGQGQGHRLGGFDLIAQSAHPGGPPAMSPVHLDGLLDEVLAGYDHVLVEAGPLVLDHSPAFDRFAAGRHLMGRADQIVVFARGESESVLDLGNWKAAAVTLGLAPPCHAVFGRYRHEFDQRQLAASLAAHTNSEAGQFSSVTFLPDDTKVDKARWNGEMVRHGKWRSKVEDLADRLADPARIAPAPLTSPWAAAAVRSAGLAVKVSGAWS